MEKGSKNTMPGFDEFERTGIGFEASTEEGTFCMYAWEGGKAWTWCIHGADGSYHSNFDGVDEFEENLDSPTCKPTAEEAYEAMRAAYEGGFAF